MVQSFDENVSLSDLHHPSSYNLTATGRIAGGEKLPGGLMGLPKGVGLGVEPNWEVLGKPILSVQ